MEIIMMTANIAMILFRSFRLLNMFYCTTYSGNPPNFTAFGACQAATGALVYHFALKEEPMTQTATQQESFYQALSRQLAGKLEPLRVSDSSTDARFQEGEVDMEFRILRGVSRDDVMSVADRHFGPAGGVAVAKGPGGRILLPDGRALHVVMSKSGKDRLRIEALYERQ